MNRFAIAFAYAVPALLMLVVFATSYMLGDSGVTTFQKVIFAPIFLLAAKGLQQYFPESLDDERSIATYAEFHIINSALLSAFIIMVAPLDTTDVVPLIIRFVVMTAAISALNIALLWYGRRKASNRK